MKETKTSLFPRGKEIDISAEWDRAYVYPDGKEIVIPRPQTLVVTDNGHHVTYKDKGEIKGIYVAYGWSSIKFRAADGKFKFHYQVEKEEKQVLLEGEKPAEQGKENLKEKVEKKPEIKDDTKKGA